jgi:hypothetical protein
MTLYVVVELHFLRMLNVTFLLALSLTALYNVIWTKVLFET